VIFSEFFEFSM